MFYDQHQLLNTFLFYPFTYFLNFQKHIFNFFSVKMKRSYLLPIPINNQLVKWRNFLSFLKMCQLYNVILKTKYICTCYLKSAQHIRNAQKIIATILILVLLPLLLIFKRDIGISYLLNIFCVLFGSLENRQSSWIMNFPNKKSYIWKKCTSILYFCT